MKQLFITTLLFIFTTGASYGSAKGGTQFQSQYCGVNVFGAPSSYDIYRVSTLCIGKAKFSGSQYYTDAVQVKFGDKSYAYYEIHDTEYLNDKQQVMFVFNEEGQAFELEVTLTTVQGEERLSEVRGQLDRGVGFRVLLNMDSTTPTEVECPYGVGIDGSTGKYLSCQCPYQFPHFNAETGMCQK